MIGHAYLLYVILFFDKWWILCVERQTTLDLDVREDANKALSGERREIAKGWYDVDKRSDDKKAGSAWRKADSETVINVCIFQSTGSNAYWSDWA